MKKIHGAENSRPGISPALSITHLSKTFRQDFNAISDISLHVNQSEFVSIIGPSGCGKSTLFSILAGLDNDFSGQILLNERAINNRQGLFGYMLQQPLLLPWKTVEENVMLGLTIRHIPKSHARLKANQLLVKFGLHGFSQHFPHALSGGIAQRVALLRTVLFNNSFLLLDEPFGALDALTRLSCQMWLQELWMDIASSILFITHDIREAILLSDRIYVFSGRPATVVKQVQVRLPRPRKRADLSQKSALLLENELETMLLDDV